MKVPAKEMRCMKQMNRFSGASRAFLITTLVLASTGFAKAQDIPPLPPLRGDAANLTDTMKFIQDKLPSKVNYMVYGHDNITGSDGSIRRSFVLTEVSADAGRCYIGFHSRFDNGKTITEKAGELLLKQVQEVSLMQMDTGIQRADAKAGHPERSIKVDPPIAVVVVRSAPNHSMAFNFYDESLAERVSRALQHAVSLCGGGKPDTF
jgi:hypothetical protein